MHITSTSTMNLQDHLDQKYCFLWWAQAPTGLPCASPSHSGMAVSSVTKRWNSSRSKRLKPPEVYCTWPKKVTQKDLWRSFSIYIIHNVFKPFFSSTLYTLYTTMLCMSYYTSTHFFSELPHLPLIDRITYFSGDDQPWRREVVGELTSI